MRIYTREQWQQLTAEQKEAVAAIEARRSTRKLRLLDQARDYPGRVAIPIILFVGMLALFVIRAPVELLLACAIVGLGGLIQFHASSVNRRLDAAVDLMESSPQPEPAQSRVEIQQSAHAPRKSRWRCD